MTVVYARRSPFLKRRMVTSMVTRIPQSLILAIHTDRSQPEMGKSWSDSASMVTRIFGKTAEVPGQIAWTGK